MPKFDFKTKVEDALWAVEPIIPLGQLVFILAQAGVGKSLVVEDLAVHTVYEQPFCGFTTMFGDVLIVDQDTPTNVLAKRLIKFSKAFPGTPPHQLFVESMKGLTLSDGTLMTVINDHPTAVLTIIDSLHTVCGKLNPNYTSDMNVWAKVKSKCLRKNNTIIVNHHISEKADGSVEILMTGNTHSLAMGSSSILQQADSYYIVGASAENGITNRIYMRPVAKRLSIRSTPIIMQVLQPSEDSEKLDYFGDYVLNLSEVESDCLTLFREFPGDRTVKDTYDNMGQKHGIQSIRDALASLNQKGMLQLSRHKSNLFKYKLP